MSATFIDLDMPTASPPRDVPGLRPNVRIAMPDGVELVGDLYVPSGQGPWPIVVERTIYGAAALGPLGACYAAHDYLFLAVDVRGRYRSGGEWDPLAYEKTDGPEVLRWAAALPECDGRVGTRGHSYGGANQLLAAPHVGECLKAMVVNAAPADAFLNVPFQGGAYDLSDFAWAWTQTGPTSQPDDDAEDAQPREATGADSAPDEHEMHYRRAFAELPLVDADIRLGLRSTFIREWMSRWRLDDYWRERSWLADLPGARVPALHISGWWDNNGRGSVLAYRALGGPDANQRLLIGPWEHSFDPPALDDLPPHEQALVARAALRDAFTDELAWFERHLKGQPCELPSAELFITGAWRWVEAAEWPPAGAAVCSWYLSAAGDLGGAPAGRGQRQYHFDPAQPNLVSSEEFPVNLAPYDTSKDIRDDVLVYRSAPLEREILAIGDVAVEIEAATTARDVDWVARLVDEYPDGRAICLRDGILRARFRHGFDRPELVTPGELPTYRIDLWHVGHLFRPGHRLRVEICSSAFGRWDVNPGDGGDLATSTERTPSEQTVFHGGAHGSRLLLPECSGSLAAELLWDT